MFKLLRLFNKLAKTKVEMTKSLSQTAMPRVTIAIPTLNRRAYLQLALESALAQTYGNIEVVVSDNASTDETASYLATCADPRLHILHQPKLLRMVENFNACISAATGEYILMLSDDDLLESNAIEELVKGYTEADEGYPAPGIVYCGGHIIDAKGELIQVFAYSPRRETARDLILSFYRRERDLWCCGTLFRTADILPGYSTSFQVAFDFAMVIGVTIKYGTAVFIPKELVRFRLHRSASHSTPNYVWRREHAKLYKLAAKTMAESDCPDPEFSGHLRPIIRQFTISCVQDRINQSYRTRKSRAILEYGQNLPLFMSLSGLAILARGLASLLLSDRIKSWLRNVRRKTYAA
jgi:glycosyltransferase involved in cell wall biosynthesis